MPGALERFTKRPEPSEFQKRLDLVAEGQQIAMLSARSEARLALTRLETAAFVARAGMEASRFVHLAADYYSAAVPSCADAVELLASAFDTGAAMTVQGLLGQSFR